jgi:hypothetical protein
VRKIVVPSTSCLPSFTFDFLFDLNRHTELSNPIQKLEITSLIFEVFTAVTMKNGVFWDVTPCGSR